MTPVRVTLGVLEARVLGLDMGFAIRGGAVLRAICVYIVLSYASK
jgi:hypothetical protein